MRRKYRSRVNFGPRYLRAYLTFSRRRRRPTGATESGVYLDDDVAAPACDGAPRAGMCTHTSFGFGKNARWAHSASRRARRCDEVRCSLGTVTAIFPLLTVLMALRASGVQ